MLYRDRSHAGRELAERLRDEYAAAPNLLVLGLPRGGVPVAYEVARELGAPLDVFVVRKLGLPGHEELAMGAIASGGVLVLNHELVTKLGMPGDVIERVAERERAELDRRERAYRGDKPPVDVAGKTVILVDDGLATGSTMRAAALAVREAGAERVVAAVPVASQRTCSEFSEDVDDVVCAAMPEPFYAVGMWYENFEPTPDEEVGELLARAARRLSHSLAEPS